MKRLLIITLFILSHISVLAASYRVDDVPNVQLENCYRFTSNPDGILSQEAVIHIDSVCYNLREEGVVQIAVVALDNIKGGSVFDFGYELFSKWGVGSQSDRGLGILLVEAEHEIRFLTGYGIEGILPDAICKRIQTEYMLPYFREGDYDAGMIAGINIIAEIIRGGDLPPEEESELEAEDFFIIFGSIGFILLLVLGACYLIYRAAHKCPKCKKIALEQQSSKIAKRRRGIITYEDTLVCAHCGKIVKRKRQDADHEYINRGGGSIIGGGGFGGGGSSGGSWGGGSFGGGGAGSRW